MSLGSCARGNDIFFLNKIPKSAAVLRQLVRRIQENPIEGVFIQNFSNCVIVVGAVKFCYSRQKKTDMFFCKSLAKVSDLPVPHRVFSVETFWLYFLNARYEIR